MSASVAGFSQLKEWGNAVGNDERKMWDGVKGAVTKEGITKVNNHCLLSSKLFILPLCCPLRGDPWELYGATINFIKIQFLSKREGIWGYMYMYSWFTLWYSRNEHTIVKQLYSNKDVKKIKFLNLFNKCLCGQK